jgi:hypothetical protein
MRRTTATVVALLCCATAASAGNIDSEHLFGLTEGSDIGTRGERELEFELAARAGKRGSAYRVLSQVSALKLTLTDSFRIAPLVAIDHHRIRSVTGLDDRNGWALSELAFEMKYRALDRQAAPFGLTFAATPSWMCADGISGERADGIGVYFAAMVDKEMIAGRLFAAVNVGYAPAVSRAYATGTWERESGIAVSAALSGRAAERVFLSGEIRYERAYDGLALDRFAGEAWFAGPALYLRIAENAWISALWNAQIAGQAAGDGRSLDLTNFERHLVKMRLGIQF